MKILLCDICKMKCRNIYFSTKHLFLCRECMEMKVGKEEVYCENCSHIPYFIFKELSMVRNFTPYQVLCSNCRGFITLQTTKVIGEDIVM